MIATAQDIIRLVALTRRPKYCTEAFVLEHGREFKMSTPPAGFKFGKMKLCFENASRLVLSYPGRYIYCEGYALTFGCCLHAWVMDRETGEAFDPTWREPGESYFGIPFSTLYLCKHLKKSEHYGLLDSDAAEWQLERQLVRPCEFLHNETVAVKPSSVNQFTPAD